MSVDPRSWVSAGYAPKRPGRQSRVEQEEQMAYHLRAIGMSEDEIAAKIAELRRERLAAGIPDFDDGHGNHVSLRAKQPTRLQALTAALARQGFPDPGEKAERLLALGRPGRPSDESGGE